MKLAHPLIALASLALVSGLTMAGETSWFADKANLNPYDRHYGSLGPEEPITVVTEEHHLQQLAISEKAGFRVGMAVQHSMLGLIYRDRGDTAQACDAWDQALALLEESGDSTPLRGKVRRWSENANCS